MDDKKIKIMHAAFAGAVLALIFITLITVYADLYPPLKNWLKAAFTHHWIGKSVLAVAVFIFSGIVIYGVTFFALKIHAQKYIRHVWFLFWTALLGTGVLFGFFIYEALFK